MTDKQSAVILIRAWITGTGHNPYFMSAEEITEVLERKRTISQEKRDKIIEQVDKIITPFEERIENLYAKIPDWD